MKFLYDNFANEIINVNEIICIKYFGHKLTITYKNFGTRDYIYCTDARAKKQFKKIVRSVKKI
jgi:hypothetical protein